MLKGVDAADNHVEWGTEVWTRSDKFTLTTRFWQRTYRSRNGLRIGSVGTASGRRIHDPLAPALLLCGESARQRSLRSSLGGWWNVALWMLGDDVITSLNVLFTRCDRMIWRRGR
jgi:hypothetical protein